MTDINNLNYFTDFVQSKVLETVKDNQAQDSSTALELAALLNELSQTIGQVKSDGSLSALSSGHVKDSNNSVPSAQDIADTLAALAKEMASLQQTMNDSADARFRASLQVQMAQLAQAMKILTDLQNFLKNFPQSMEDFQNWLSQQSQQFQDWFNHTVNRYSPGTGDSWTQKDPLISKITQAITDYVKEKFGITLKLGTSYNSLGDILADATNQVKAGLDTALHNHINQVYNQLKAMNNPIVQALVQMLERGHKITAKDLENLQNLLNQLLKVLSEMAKASADNDGQGPSNALVVSMLSMMSGAMNELSGVVAQSSSNKQQADALIAQAMVKQAQAALEKAQAQEAEIERQKAAQNAMSIFMKVIEAVVAVVISAIAIAFGQVQIAVIAMTMMIMQESGALDKISGAIAQSLIKDGLSPENAKIVADVITTVLVIVVSCAASFAGNLATIAETAATRAASTASEEGIEMTAMGASQVATPAAEAALSTASETAASATSWFQKASQLLSKLNIFNQFSPQVNAVIFSATQSMMQTNLVADATVAALTAEHKDAKTIAQAQMIAQIVSSVVFSIVSAGSMAGMMSTTNAVQSAANTSRLMKMIENFGASLRQGLPSTLFTGISQGTQFVATGLEAGANLGLGISLTKQAEAETAVGEANASATFYNNLAQTTTDGMLATQRNAAAVIKAHQAIDAEVNRTMNLGQAEFARLFSQAV